MDMLKRQGDQYVGLKLNFLIPERFEMVQLNTETGEIKIDNENTFIAHNLLDAYHSFMASLIQKRFYNSNSPLKMQKTKLQYLLIGQNKPVVTSITLPCVLFNGNEEGADCESTGLSYQEDYSSQIMIGWAI